MLNIVLSTVNLLLSVYSYLILARILMSWLPDVGEMTIGKIIIALTEPYMAPFRRMIPPLRFGGTYMDISVLVALVAYAFVSRGLLLVLTWLLSALGMS